MSFTTDARFDPRRIFRFRLRSSGLFVAVELSRINLMSAQPNCAVDGRPLYWKRRWERGFAVLRTFRARKGHCCPSRRHLEGGFNLGQWVSVQRYRKDLMPAERKRRLDKIGFVWDWRDNFWEQNFAALLKFKRRKGHCCVPTLHREGDLKLLRRSAEIGTKCRPSGGRG
jgi:hypothetical protein